MRRARRPAPHQRRIGGTREGHQRHPGETPEEIGDKNQKATPVSRHRLSVEIYLLARGAQAAQHLLSTFRSRRASVRRARRGTASSWVVGSRRRGPAVRAAGHFAPGITGFHRDSFGPFWPEQHEGRDFRDLGGCGPPAPIGWGSLTRTIGPLTPSVARWCGNAALLTPSPSDRATFSPSLAGASTDDRVSSTPPRQARTVSAPV
jgi:hypothetical protein